TLFRSVHRAGYLRLGVAREPVHDVDDRALGVLLRVEDADRLAADGERAGVAHLAARLAVERRPVQDDLVAGFLARADRARLEEARALDGERVVADELDGPAFVGLRLGGGVPGVHLALIHLEGAGRAGAVLLLLHQLVEAGHVHGQALLAGHQRGEVGREAVRIVEQEGYLTGE